MTRKWAGHTDWSLLLAAVAVVLAGIMALRWADWGRDTATRLFLWPIEDALRRLW